MWGSVGRGNGGESRDTYIELVATAVENSVVSDLVGGEGRMDIQLTVLNEKIIFRGGGHFKFVVADRGGQASGTVAGDGDKHTRSRQAECQETSR